MSFSQNCKGGSQESPLHGYPGSQNSLGPHQDLSSHLLSALLSSGLWGGFQLQGLGRLCSRTEIQQEPGREAPIYPLFSWDLSLIPSFPEGKNLFLEVKFSSYFQVTWHPLPKSSKGVHFPSRKIFSCLLMGYPIDLTYLSPLPMKSHLHSIYEYTLLALFYLHISYCHSFSGSNS